MVGRLKNNAANTRKGGGYEIQRGIRVRIR
jgi:hypothetical protein